VSPDDLRAKRKKMFEEGHVCTDWWRGCPLCAARKAEIDAKYPVAPQDNPNAGA
jgi:hypothetical protein